MADLSASGGALDEAARENARLERRVMRLEALLEQVEKIRDANGKLMDRLMSDLDRERTRSRELLLNTLPETIVERLDAGETRIADGHERVVVLLSDLVGFTEAAARMTPIELVDGLNALVTQFDAACERRGVEKIKTIGDAYMAVAGLDSSPGDLSDEPIVAAAELALDMFAALSGSASDWQMRIGLHAGPVVTGIIGSRKFAFDVWGDTVNVAARLESTSEPGRIHVSQPVAEALQAAGGFELIERGEVELKGKGSQPTWFLAGRRRPVGP